MRKVFKKCHDNTGLVHLPQIPLGVLLSSAFSFFISNHFLIFLCHFIVFTGEEKSTSSVVNVSITKIAVTRENQKAQAQLPALPPAANADIS